MRSRALHLMREGLATPGEISRALGISRMLVVNWRHRAQIDTTAARAMHVRALLERRPKRKPLPPTDDPPF